MTFDFDRLDELHRDPLKIVVVGHTNHGKTSTMRTLCEDANFGEVDDGPGTTTGVACKRNQIGGRTTFLIYDTPGLEDLDELLLEIQSKLEIRRQPSIDEILQHLRTDGNEKRKLVFRTLDEITNSHVIIYVIDIREPVNQCYKDEVECLNRSTCPLVVAFNFSKTKSSDRKSWVEYFKSVGIHTFTEFDAHKRTRSDEERLFEKMQTLVEDDSLHEEFLKNWNSYRKRRSRDAVKTSAGAIYEMVEELVDKPVVRKRVTKEMKDQVEQEAREELNRIVEKRKNSCIEEIAEAFGFSWEDLSNETPDDADPECLINFNVFDVSGLRWIVSGSGAVAGAAIGGTIDAFVDPASFGLGAAIGGVIGAAGGYVAATAYEYNYDEGPEKITVKLSTPVILLLVGLGVSAARALKVRGRANPHEVKLAFDKNAFKPSKELKELYTKSWSGKDTLRRLREEITSAIPTESEAEKRSPSHSSDKELIATGENGND